ncbi:MAG: threonine synthase [Alistipes onderdonkii]
MYDFPLPLRRVGSRYTLELFHGPTFAFKDYGAGFMGRMIGLMGGAGEKLVILTATSGDTGSAVAHGFYGVPGVEVVLLYPEGKISRLQECQMTTLGGNIHPLRVAGTFDDCQRLVKGCLPTQNSVRGHRVSSANSINSCCAGYRRHSIISTAIACGGSRRAADAPVVVVPSGNYGNLSAGMLARRMGLPSADSSRLRTGTTWCPSSCAAAEYRPRPSVRTPANAMDVGAPSNFERMLWLCGGEPDALRDELEGFRCDDAMIRRTIDGLHRNYGYLFRPAQRHRICRFRSVRETGILPLYGASPPNSGRSSPRHGGCGSAAPPRLARLACLPRVSEPMAADLGALEAIRGRDINRLPGRGVAVRAGCASWPARKRGCNLCGCNPFLRIGAPGAGRA